jgi:hypothetical protein
MRFMYGTTTPVYRIRYTDFHYSPLLRCHPIASGHYHLSVLTDHLSILQYQT